MKRQRTTSSSSNKRVHLEVPQSVTVSYSKGDDSKDQGDRSVVKARMPKQMSMYEKFRLNAESANSYTTLNRWTYLRQGTIDKWGLTTTDSNGNTLEFFTPRKFKDIEACNFFSKVLSGTSYQTTTLAANGPTMDDIYVQYSHVRVSLTNITQRRTTVQMFICYGKNGEGTASPINDLANVFSMYRNFSGVTAADPNIDPMSSKEWLQLWDVTKVEFKLEQGEHQSYLLKGPKNYVLDPKLHLPQGTLPTTANPTWDAPNLKGNGCYVFFRMLNDLCLVGNNDAGTATTALMGRKIGAHHPINPIPPVDGSQQGCVIVRMTEYYHIKAPLGAEASESRRYLANFHTIAGSTYTETNVDTDQAYTLPTSFI